MQAAKKAVETIKETAANIGASAKSGLEKTKATVQEKAEKMTAHDPVLKEMATEKKEERIQQAEREKQEAREHNAAAKQSATAGHMEQAHYTTTGPGSQTATYSTTGPRSRPAAYSTTGPGSGPVTYSTTAGGQPMGATQMSAMPEHGPERGERDEEVMGSNPTGTNTGMGRTTVHNSQMGGTATGSGRDFS